MLIELLIINIQIIVQLKINENDKISKINLPQRFLNFQSTLISSHQVTFVDFVESNLSSHFRTTSMYFDIVLSQCVNKSLSIVSNVSNVS